MKIILVLFFTFLNIIILVQHNLEMYYVLTLLFKKKTILITILWL